MSNENPEQTFAAWQRMYPGKFPGDLHSYIELDEVTAEPTCTVKQRGIVTGIEPKASEPSGVEGLEIVEHVAVVMCPACLACGLSGEILQLFYVLGCTDPKKRARDADYVMHSPNIRNFVRSEASKNCPLRQTP